MILNVAIASTSGMAVLAGTWMHGFFTTPVSVGGLDPRPVVAAGQYWSSQNLLAQSNNKQPIKCILLLLALQTAPTSIHRALLTKVIFCFWFLGQKPNLILRAFKFEDNHNRLRFPSNRVLKSTKRAKVNTYFLFIKPTKQEILHFFG